jgi:hypothetical protein
MLPHWSGASVSQISNGPEIARQVIQTVIFTSLRDEEIERLREQNTRVVTPDGLHFLKLITPSPVETPGSPQ